MAVILQEGHGIGYEKGEKEPLLLRQQRSRNQGKKTDEQPRKSNKKRWCLSIVKFVFTVSVLTIAAISVFAILARYYNVPPSLESIWFWMLELESSYPLIVYVIGGSAVGLPLLIWLLLRKQLASEDVDIIDDDTAEKRNQPGHYHDHDHKESINDVKRYPVKNIIKVGKADKDVPSQSRDLDVNIPTVQERMNKYLTQIESSKLDYEKKDEEEIPIHRLGIDVAKLKAENGDNDYLNQIEKGLELLDVLNPKRELYRLKLLTLDTGNLYKVAKWYADDILNNYGGFPKLTKAHIGSDGSSVFERVEEIGGFSATVAISARENILMRPDCDAKAAFKQWCKSRVHKSNMMADDINTMSLAYSYNAKKGEYYYTQVFLNIPEASFNNGITMNNNENRLNSATDSNSRKRLNKDVKEVEQNRKAKKPLTT